MLKHHALIQIKIIYLAVVNFQIVITEKCTKFILYVYENDINDEKKSNITYPHEIPRCAQVSRPHILNGDTSHAQCASERLLYDFETRTHPARLMLQHKITAVAKLYEYNVLTCSSFSLSTRSKFLIS